MYHFLQGLFFKDTFYVLHLLGTNIRVEIHFLIQNLQSGDFGSYPASLRSRRDTIFLVCEFKIHANRSSRLAFECDPLFYPE